MLLATARSKHGDLSQLTLNIGNALLENLLEGLGILKLLLDLGDDGGSKLLLLALLDLALVTHPRVENSLGLSGKGSALLELISLSLELGSLLYTASAPIPALPCKHNPAILPWRRRRGSW